MGVTELQEQLGISEEAGVSIRQIAKQAMNENAIFLKFFGKEKMMSALPGWPGGTRS